jgi:integrase
MLAKVWFGEAMAELKQQQRPYTRADLERAGKALFDRLADETRHRSAAVGSYALSPAEQTDLSRDRVRELEAQLKSNELDATARRLAGEIVRSLGLTVDDLTAADGPDLLHLAARIDRLSHLFVAHQMTKPWTPFVPDDNLSLPGVSSPLATAPPTDFTDSGVLAVTETRTLGQAIDSYLSWKAVRVDSSQHDEIRRALLWLADHLGETRLLVTIDKAAVRGFRDGLERLDVTLRGKAKVSFADRQTNDPTDWVSTVTARRYLTSVQAFFQREVAEGHLEADPSAGLKIEARKGETTRTPEPFSTEELKRLFATPLYAGHKSPKLVFAPGDNHSRGSHFWIGLLGLFTGMRAGEIAQLLGSDFDFSSSVQVIHVRAEDSGGNKVKKTKSPSATRDIPIAPVLIALGLSEFVARRTKGGNTRVFRDVPFGAKDRRSDGITKAWGRLLKTHGLHKPGRSFHVFRHTATAALRRSGQSEAIIGAILGHAPTTVTGGYGGTFPIERLYDAVGQIDFGFDVATALGGSFDPNRHVG